jgi:hypothetical protein
VRHVCENGTDFIVHASSKNGYEPKVFKEVNKKETLAFLDTQDWNEWYRIRAMSEEDALARFTDVSYQYEYHENGYGSGETYEGNGHTEAEMLNIVLLPQDERPEFPAKKG